MIYQGSKASLRKYIVPFIQGCIDRNRIDTYIEPFVGGANMIDHIRCEKRIGADINSELISLLNYIKNFPAMSIFPDNCTFDHYKSVREHRKNKDTKYSPEYTAGIGYFASYGGRYFDGGYGRDKRGGRNIYRERLLDAMRQAPLLKDIQFYAEHYESFLGTKGCVFYLDPPYRDTKNYRGKKFDSDKFVSFTRELAKENYVFVSEFFMPEDFRCIWEKERPIRQKSDRTTCERKTERLFTVGISAV